MPYEMCVNTAVLDELTDSLKKIQNNLISAAEEMSYAINESQDLLEGRQFELAKEITGSCIQATGKTNANINRALKYLSQLSEQIELYNSCKY